MDANSTPTAPAPMMASDFGTVVRFRISILVRIRSGSGCKPGQHARFRAGGDDDVARFQGLRTLRALHFDAPAALQPGVALDPLDLVLAQQELDALGVLVDDAVLLVDRPSGSRGPGSRNGCRRLPGCRKCSQTSAVCSSAFVGMQPTSRHVPPNLGCFSMSAVFRPYWPARMAAEYPPGPLPITIRS